VAFEFGGATTTRNVTVSANSQKAVSINISTNVPGSHWPHIEGEPVGEVQVDSRLDINSVETNQSLIDIGETVLVTTELKNPTESWANESIDIDITGDQVTKEVTVPPGENTTLEAVLKPAISGTAPIRIAGAQTETSVDVDGVLEIVEGSVSINRSTVSTGETIAVNFTYRNPSGSGYTTDREIFISAAGDHAKVPVALSPGETRDVNITLTPTEAASPATIRAEDKNVGTVEVETPVVIEDVDYDYKVAHGETSTVTYVLNNTDDARKQSRTIDTYGNTNDDDRVSAQDTFELNASETKTVTQELNPPAAGDYHLTLADGRTGGLAVLDDTTGEANITTNVRDTESVSIRNEARFYANVTNNGTADGADLITLRRSQDGPIIESDAVLAEPGQSEFGSVSMEFSSPGNKTVYVNGEAVNLTVTEPYVLDTNISVINGTVPDSMPVAEGGYDRGHLNIEFRINDRRASSYDLGELGADKSTRFKTNLTVRDFDPDMVIATGQGIEWNATSISENKTNITLYVNPVDQSYLQDAPSLGEWGDTQRTANITFENMVQFRVYGDSPDSSQNFGWGNGLAISTNAQRYSAPRFYQTENGSRFEVKLAAAHFREDGSLNTGHYTAQIPDEMLNEWGVDSPSELEAAYTGANDTTIDITETSDGIEATIDLHYSSGTVSVGEEKAVQAVTETNQNDDSKSDSSDSDSDTDTNQGSDSGTPNSKQEEQTTTATTDQTPTETTTETTSSTTTTDVEDSSTTQGSDELTTTTLSETETTNETPTSEEETVSSTQSSTGTTDNSGSSGGSAPGFSLLTTIAVIGILCVILAHRGRLSE